METTNQTKPTVPAGWLLGYLMQQGISLKEAWADLKLREQTGATTLTLESYLQLFEWAAVRLDDPVVGIHVADNSTPGDYGLLAYLVTNSPTLREGFDLLERYHGTFSTEFAFHFTYAQDKSACTYNEAFLPGANSQQDILFSLATQVNRVREYAGSEWQPIGSRFVFQEPADIYPIQERFGQNLRFNQATNAIEIETRLLDLPNQSADASLLPILLQQANQLLDTLSGQKSLVEKLRLMILSSLGAETLTTDNAAGQLNMSVRSLHRQLGELNTSFRHVREEVVIKVAKEALLTTDLSITEIATRLNYSETSSLDRMFKRVTGSSPRSFRTKSL